MKTSLKSCLLAAALLTPMMVWAQGGSTITRAQVRDELIELEHAGYSPAAASPYYPADIQAAEARVAVAHGNAVSGYGTGANGASDAGRPAVSKGDWRAMYDHP
ncbi:DUF4148 domain-containing protein [Paraburkholderia sp. MM5384-R2]|uniref:DUF4148 domain-containing protein n=1 Tax=Paraburkholderia sp. MM5384-R2 TaxID=2723097 RepID=UPI001607E82B|nr:DUF4148 domain-containing protein [Paraburkholderia sp. MM5384-R2]MBB5499380.1 hypothetical protein [Paraburkholderia sp. MM5384-R2]